MSENEKPLKIALFCDSFFPMMDGVAMVIDNYARLLSKKHEVTVFVPRGREDFDDSKLPYKVVRCNKKFGVFFLDYDLPLPQFDKNFKKEALENRFDIVHIHSPVTIGKFGLKVAKKQKIPAIFHAHSQFKQDIYRSTKSHLLSSIGLKFLMKVVNGCDECWAVNKRVAELFKEYGTKIPMKVEENGTEIQPLTENREEKIKQIRKEYNVKDNEKLLLFVGRLNILKNILFLCDALKILKDRGFKFKMLYVGAGQDEKKLRKRIKKNGLENEVTLTGKILDREKLKTIYAAADLFCFPSLYDTNSLVQIEAASQYTATLFIDGAVTSGNATYDVDSYASAKDPATYAGKIIEIFSDEERHKKVCLAAKKNLCITWQESVAKAEKDYFLAIEKYEKQ